MQRLFAEYQFDCVYHLAAYVAEELSHFIRRFNYANNLIGSVNLINEAVKHDVKYFVFTSSIAVCGVNQLTMTEDLTPQPEDPYGIAKYAVELDLRAAHEMFGFDYIIFRPHNVYGENQNIGDRIMQSQPMTIFGDGSQTRAFSYIDDVAPVIARSVDVPTAYNQVFNVGADQPHTVQYLAQTVARAFGFEPAITYLPARNEVQHAYPDHSKAQRIFGQDAPVSLEDGVDRMAAWAQRVGARANQTFGDIEITRNLPPSWRS